MQNWVTKASKISLTGLVIATTGWAMLTLNPPVEAVDGKGVTLIKEGHADIVTSSLAERSSTQKFAASLEKLGHEPPRVYDYNGNTVYFSTRHIQGKTPMDVVQEYQHEFVVQGLNSKQHLTPMVNLEMEREDATDERKAEIDAQLSDIYKGAAYGEITPQAILPDYVSMGGAEYDHDSLKGDSELAGTMEERTKKLEDYGDRFHRAYIACGGSEEVFEKAMDQALGGEMTEAAEKMGLAIESQKRTCSGGMCSEELRDYSRISRRLDGMRALFDADESLQSCPQMNALFTRFREATAKQFEQRVKAIRQIEVFFNKETGATAATALWSDEDFDLSLATLEDIPDAVVKSSPLGRCDGCKRAMNFKGHGKEDQYGTDMVRAKRTPDEVKKFYIRDLGEKGWKLAPTHVTVKDIYKAEGVQQDANEEWLHFARGNEHLTLRISHDEATGTTTLTSNMSD